MDLKKKKDSQEEEEDDKAFLTKMSVKLLSLGGADFNIGLLCQNIIQNLKPSTNVFI